MESQIKNLIEKYWSGETTLEEEKTILAYFSKNDTLAPESKYFSALTQLKSLQNPNIKHPKSETKVVWYRAAAIITLGLLAGFWTLQENQQRNIYEIDDPREALEITQSVFGIMSEKIDLGKEATSQLNKMEDIKKILIENNEN